MTREFEDDEPHRDLDGLMTKLRLQLWSQPVPPRLQELARLLDQALAARDQDRG